MHRRGVFDKPDKTAKRALNSANSTTLNPGRIIEQVGFALSLLGGAESAPCRDRLRRGVGADTQIIIQGIRELGEPLLLGT